MSMNRKGAIRKVDGRTYGALENRNEAPSASGVDSSRPGGSGGLADSNDRLKDMRNEVNEVKEILHDNIEKIIERDGKINNLVDRTGEIVIHSNSFHNIAKEVRKDAQRRNWKLTCCIVCVVVVVVGIVTIIILSALKVIKI